jgi:hypothetical protein
MESSIIQIGIWCPLEMCGTNINSYRALKAREELEHVMDENAITNNQERTQDRKNRVAPCFSMGHWTFYICIW